MGLAGRPQRWPWGESGWLAGVIAAAIAAITIGGTFSSQTHQHQVRHLDVVGVALLAVICAAMVLRRRSPVATLLIVAAGACVYFGVGYPWGPVFLPLTLAVASAVLAGYRLTAWIACGVTYVFIVWGGYYLGGVGRRPGAAGAIEAAAWPLLVLIGAEVLRSGRERAASAAHSRAELSRRRASEERLRIAQELHDVLAHNISLISVQAGVALHLMDERPDQAADQARTALSAIRQASKEALGELRSVLGLLRASGEHPPLAPVPGIDQLSDLTSRASAAGLTVRTDITGEKRPLPAETDLAAYRIVQEALTNVIRHAGATSVTVRVTYGGTSLGVEIEDDGHGAAIRTDSRGTPGADAAVPTRWAANGAPGADAASTPGAGSGPDGGGNGIAGMQERARLLGGELTAGPLPGAGFVVRARLPMRGSSAGADTPGTGGGGTRNGAGHLPGGTASTARARPVGGTS